MKRGKGENCMDNELKDLKIASFLASPHIKTFSPNTGTEKKFNHSAIRHHFRFKKMPVRMTSLKQSIIKAYTI